jgi:CarD family transcriptional regulator
MDVNWNRRLRENNEKLKTGDPTEVAGVIRNLVRVEREKKLSSGEKKMLNSARQILSSEIAMIYKITDAEADAMIEKAI